MSQDIVAETPSVSSVSDHAPTTSALYRRYRPESFHQVIGQEHVTDPLMQALRSNRVNHAYLFSGPRGCGKTTSARILARILNCHARVPDAAGGYPAGPCGQCPSCVDLARNGGGSLDVVEIDAASHGGVDDARDLRERASFAPARDKFKIFVIDEAHMVTPAGFNALLKIVEEPPPHVRFVFATTEPDKVLVTIRSRTHHYPFRLVPPAALQEYLQQLCDEEQIAADKGVLPLVVRAGGGSVRDSLSVLDQLMSGAVNREISYELAVNLLGYTHTSLLDDVMQALGAHDAAAVFRVVDRVVESGHDPRRFVEDLLERFRDLVICRAVGEAAAHVLRSISDDQRERLMNQAASFGDAELSRLADVTNEALTDMIGATSPRLHLELLCARLLLPGTDEGARGLAARIDRLERRQTLGFAPSEGAAQPPAHPSESTPPAPVRQTPQVQAPVSRGREQASPAGQSGAPPAADSSRQSSASSPDPQTASPAPASPVAAGSVVDALRRSWPDVLDAIAQRKRGTWTLVSQNAHVHDVTPSAIRLGFSTEGLTRAFNGGSHPDVVREALDAVLGVRLNVEGVTAPGGGGGDGGGGSTPQPAPTPAAPRVTAKDAAPPPAASRPPVEPPQAVSSAPPHSPAPVPTPQAASAPDQVPAQSRADTGAGMARLRAASAVVSEDGESNQAYVAPEDDVVDLNDPNVEDSDMTGAVVIQRLLGGAVVDA